MYFNFYTIKEGKKRNQADILGKAGARTSFV